MAIGGGEGLVGNDVRMGVAKAARGGAADKVVQRLVGETGDADVEQAHIDMLALAGARRMHHRGKNGGGGIGAGQNIDKRHPDLHRHAVRFAGHAHQPAHALDHEIIAGAVRVGPVLAEAGDRAIDNPRIHSAQRLVIQPVSGQPADLEILDKHIAFGGKPAQDVGAFRCGDVDGERSLVAVDRTEIGGSGSGVAVGVAGHLVGEWRAPASRVITASRAFDLDDVGTEIAEHLRCPGTG